MALDLEKVVSGRRGLGHSGNVARALKCAHRPGVIDGSLPAQSGSHCTFASFFSVSAAPSRVTGIDRASIRLLDSDQGPVPVAAACGADRDRRPAPRRHRRRRGGAGEAEQRIQAHQERKQHQKSRKQKEKRIQELEELIQSNELKLEQLRDCRFEPEYYHDFKKMEELNLSIDEQHNVIAKYVHEWETLSLEMEEEENNDENI